MMENTKRNKAKFFALYWGQKVREVKGVDTIDKWVGFIEATLSIEKQYLLLKPLSSITEEDAIEVAKAIYAGGDDYQITFNTEDCTSVSPFGRPSYADEIDINSSGIISYESSTGLSILHAFDLLRSKGYALPWMGLSIEQMVQFGWIKLIENAK